MDKKEQKQPQKKQKQQEQTKPKRNGYLMQILFNVVVIGAFTVVQNWLWFYYAGSWTMPVIFNVLTVLMCCLLAVNVYHCIADMTGNESQSKETDNKDKLALALLYKEIKNLKAELSEIVNQSADGDMEAWKEQLQQQLQELKLNQLRSAKAVIAKEEELQKIEEQIQQKLENISVENFVEAVANLQPQPGAAGVPDIEPMAEEPVLDVSEMVEEPVLDASEPTEEPVLDVSEMVDAQPETEEAEAEAIPDLSEMPDMFAEVQAEEPESMPELGDMADVAQTEEEPVSMPELGDMADMFAQPESEESTSMPELGDMTDIFAEPEVAEESISMPELGDMTDIFAEPEAEEESVSMPELGDMADIFAEMQQEEPAPMPDLSEMEDSAPQEEAPQEEASSGIDTDALTAMVGDNPNKELSPDEIAALFAGIN